MSAEAEKHLRTRIKKLERELEILRNTLSWLEKAKEAGENER